MGVDFEQKSGASLGFIGYPLVKGNGYGFTPRVRIRNAITNGDESAQRATRPSANGYSGDT